MRAIIKKGLKKLFNINEEDLFLRRQLKIPFKEIRRLKGKEKVNTDSVLFGKKIKTTNSFWHLHSLKEIFIDEVYKFSPGKSNPYIIDCGANIGVSILYFKTKYPHSRIVAFEADEKIYSLLEENLDTFGISGVKIYQKAVWNENGSIQFDASGNLGGRIAQFANADQHSNSLITIPAIRLRTFLCEKVDFLKIDIEGAEVAVLKDCADLLFNVNNIFVEYHSAPSAQQELNLLLTIMEAAGFRVYVKEAWNNLPHPYMHKQYNPVWDLQLNIFGYRV